MRANAFGNFWQILLVNLKPDEGRVASDEAPTAGGLLALWWKCPHLGCTIPWKESFVSPFDDESTPSEMELRVAQAQLVGWLEGLFHGIQATLFAQQMAARTQLEKIRGELPAGPTGTEVQSGNYL